MAKKEYIERESVINSIKKMRLQYQTTRMYGGVRFGIDSAVNYIMQEPAADVVEVVRCKDCKHYHNHPNGLCYLHTEPYGDGYKGNAVCVEPSDFCSYGERKDG